MWRISLGSWWPNCQKEKRAAKSQHPGSRSPGAPSRNVARLSVFDVEPGNINTVVNFADVLILIKAFQGETYPFGPADPDGHYPYSILERSGNAGGRTVRLPHYDGLTSVLRPSSAKNTGRTRSVSIVDVTTPPMTTVAGGRGTSAPAPMLKAIGTDRRLATKPVISTGRRRVIMQKVVSNAGEFEKTARVPW